MSGINDKIKVSQNIRKTMLYVSNRRGHQPLVKLSAESSLWSVFGLLTRIDEFLCIRFRLVLIFSDHKLYSKGFLMSSLSQVATSKSDCNEIFIRYWEERLMVDCADCLGGLLPT